MNVATFGGRLKFNNWVNQLHNYVSSQTRKTFTSTESGSTLFATLALCDFYFIFFWRGGGGGGRWGDCLWSFRNLFICRVFTGGQLSLSYIPLYVHIHPGYREKSADLQGTLKVHL